VNAELARRFADYRWQRPWQAPRVTVRLHDAVALPADLEEALSRVVAAACGPLGLPTATVALARDRTLPEGGYEVAIGGVTRVSGSLGMPLVDWWRQHPVAGQGGRLGLASIPDDPTDALPPTSQLVRAVEAVVWDDPGLLVLSEEAAIRELLEPRLYMTQHGPSSWGAWRTTLRQLAALRLPLGALRELKRPQPTDQFAWRLRRYQARLELGAELPDQVHVERLRTELIPQVLEQVVHATGVQYPTPTVGEAAGLGPRTYRVVIEALPRGSGVLPASGATDPLWVHPLSGAPAADGLEELLAAHVGACLLEASAEYADVDWLERDLLDPLQAILPDLASTLRQVAEPPVLAAALGRLLAERFSLWDRQLLERVTEFGLATTTAAVADAAEASWICELPGARGDPVALAEFARFGTAETLRRRLAGRPVVTLDAGLIAELRRALGSGSPPLVEAVDRFQGTGGLLRQLDAVACRHGSPEPPVVLAPLDLRAPLARMVRAQFPRIAVATRDEVDGSAAPVASLSLLPGGAEEGEVTP
jgi:hypothetical protein